MLVRSLVPLVAAALLVAAAPDVRAADATPVLPLWRALRERLVSVKGHSEHGYSVARLEIDNRSGRTLSVDVNASYLRPRTFDRSVQPLGLGLLNPGSAVTSIDLGPGKRNVSVLSVCMDHGAATPDADLEYSLATHEAPGVIGLALRDWKARPSIDQSVVQESVWGHQRLPGARDAIAGVPHDLPRDTARVAIVGGAVFALSRDGRLDVAERPGAPFNAIASDVADLHAGADALRVLVPSEACEPGWRVARCDPATATLATELELPKRARLRWAGPRAAIVVEEGKLVLHTAEGLRAAVGEADDALSPAGRGVFVLGSLSGRPWLTVVKLDRSHPAGATVTGRQPCDRARAIAPAPSGAYVVSTDGAVSLVDDSGEPVRAVVRLALDGRSPRAALSTRHGLLVTAGATAVLRPTGSDAGGRDVPLPGTPPFVDHAGGEAYAWNGHAVAHLERLANGSFGWVEVLFVEGATRTARPR